MRRRAQRANQPWNIYRPPVGRVTVDRGRYPDLRHLFWPRTGADLVTGAQLVRNSGNERLAVAGGGLGYDFSLGTGTRIVSRPTVVPPSAGWTIELVVEMVSYGGGAVCRHDQSAAGSGTQDRSLYVNASSRWEAYVFDGGAKTASNSTLQDLNVPAHVAATCTSSSLTCFFAGVPGTSTGVSNSGFTGYSGIHFIVGIATIARVYMAAVHHRALSAAEIAARAASPYDLLIPAG